MAELAKAKLPNADIRVADMRDYDFGDTFDAVLCVYDSLNHLVRWHDWVATFANVFRHLNQGGVFIFDFSTVERLNWVMANPPIGREMGKGEQYLILSLRNEGDGYAWENLLFTKEADERFSLDQRARYVTAFSVTQVRAEVERLFTIEEVVDPKGLTAENPEWRPFWACKKKKMSPKQD